MEFNEEHYQVLKYVAEGKTDEWIAKKMGTTVSQAKTKVRRLLTNSGCINRTELVYRATKADYI